LLLGTIPMLVVAGVIEGFFSPSAVPVPAKFTLAAVLFAALMSYLFLWSPDPSKRASKRAAPPATAAVTANSAL
jgi:peptidoglycan biosynthesis protein MviN/MurJ (putative lipid II flippase)